MLKHNRFYTTIILFALLSCSTDLPDNSSDKAADPGKAFTKYWYGGEAELSSYTLEQARYGEIHKGSAVLVYVTEPFSGNKQVKADQESASNIPMLKLNFTKKFNTGIYPYSMMSSIFMPIKNRDHALKITTSSQEWCGHTFMQLNNKDRFKIQLSSYFESEGDQILSINKNWLEDEFWTKVRIDPKTLPTGKVEVVPSFFYLRLMHKEIRAYRAAIEVQRGKETTAYTINYPDLKRTVAFTYQNEFPHKILNWEESYQSGFGASAKQLTTKGRLNKTIKSPYWSKNKNKDAVMRKELGLQ